MIRLDNVSKHYSTRHGKHHVLNNIQLQLNVGEALAICGHNGAGKSTLLRLIAGVEKPSSGRITRDMSVSWPIGLSSSFQSSLSGADNARFIARVYNRGVDDVLSFVEEFAELGDYLKMPIRTYSAGMSARLAFAISLAVDFDCYLIDEITAVGDARFQERCREALLARKQRGTLVMVSHDANTLRDYCDHAVLVRDGSLEHYDVLEDAIAAHFEV